MSNTERIQANNSELREAIEMAEKLPDASEGGTPTPTQEKTVDITENGTHTVIPDDGYALSKVTANVSVPIPDGYIVPSGELEITENGEYDITDKASVIVAVEEAGGGGEVTPPTTPTDGKTRVYIHLEHGRTSPMLGVCPKGTVTVDWGDGTKPDTLTGTNTTTVKWTPTHEYTAPGDYVIALTVEGTMGFYGHSAINQCSGILRYASGSDTRNQAYQSAVQKVEIGEGVTSIGNYAFNNCYSLASITIPESVTSIGNYAFNNCYSLASITIPESVTSIGNYAFNNCYSLASITIPESVTSIGYYAFNNCSGMRYYDFTACTSVPALPNTNAFSGITSDCEMLIPAALYDEWRAATNWATYASYMVAV